MLGGLVILAVIFRLSAHFSKICLPIFEIDLDVLNPWYEGKNDYIFLLKVSCRVNFDSPLQRIFEKKSWKKKI